MDRFTDLYRTYGAHDACDPRGEWGAGGRVGFVHALWGIKEIRFQEKMKGPLETVGPFVSFNFLALFFSCFFAGFWYNNFCFRGMA